MADTEGAICLDILCGTPQARKEDYLSALNGASRNSLGRLQTHLHTISLKVKHQVKCS